MYEIKVIQCGYLLDGFASWMLPNKTKIVNSSEFYPHVQPTFRLRPGVGAWPTVIMTHAVSHVFCKEYIYVYLLGS